MIENFFILFKDLLDVYKYLYRRHLYFHNLGVSLMNLNKFNIAITCLKKAIINDRENRKFVNQNIMYIGLSYFYLGNFFSALKYLKKVHNTFLEKEVFSAKIISYSLLGDLNKSIEMSEKLIEEDSQNIDYLLFHISLLHSLKKNRDAIFFLNKAKDLIKKNEPFLNKYYYAIEELLNNNLQNAIKLFTSIFNEFTEYMKLSFDISEVCNYLYEIYIELKENNKAFEIIEKAVIRKKIFSIELYNNLAYEYAIRGLNLNRALKLINKCIQIQPQNFILRDTKGLILMKMKKFRYAKKEFEKSLKYFPFNKKTKLQLNKITISNAL